MSSNTPKKKRNADIEIEKERLRKPLTSVPSLDLEHGNCNHIEKEKSNIKTSKQKVESER